MHALFLNVCPVGNLKNIKYEENIEIEILKMSLPQCLTSIITCIFILCDNANFDALFNATFNATLNATFKATYEAFLEMTLSVFQICHYSYVSSK